MQPPARPKGRPTASRPPSFHQSRTHPRPAPLTLAAASTKGSLTASTSSAAPSTTSAKSPDPPSSPRSARKEAEGNIQVVVRCRRLSPTEERLSLPVVASASPTRGSLITLTNPSPSLPSSSVSSSSAPVPAVAPTKSYNFGERPGPPGGKGPLGNVFGPEADQGMVYFDVAKPILGQVLQGYNCTIFAYGQTGTGKTYTMEGDLSPYHGTFSPEAGIIPRTLFALFDQLAADQSDFAVRCSFVELYNEELRDLNASSYPGDPDGGGLRIYEEKTGTGVVIMGLEETLISSAEEGLRVLKRGSERRQMAATRCNDQSSRSHSIFTLQIHIKEVSKATGEELLKVGKLNLVDLAGSENVGRSGAEKGRALREAGMINASLLALGRVINKLVEKQGHIPYRESKLTRLLQDSLGGRTRTTIIATVSPVNFEETISTLDYAFRAKTIQNRPEVNQRMTKMALLREYGNEIERLKEDLLAAREKNGVFLSSASWTDLQATQESQALLLSTTKKELEILDSQLESVRAQFEQNLRLLGTKEDELRRLAEGLRGFKERLARTGEELEQRTRAEREERVVREAFERSREGWRGAAEEAREDVEGLRAKLERKKTVEASNRAVLGQASVAFHSTSTALAAQLEGFALAQTEFTAQLQTRLESFALERATELETTKDFVSTRLDSLATASQELLETAGALESHGTLFLDLVEQTRVEILESTAEEAAKADEWRTTRGSALVAELERHSVQTLASIEKLIQPVMLVEERIKQALLQDQERLRRIQEEDQAALAEENERLKALVAHLTQALEAERHASAQEDAEIVALLAAKLDARSRRAFGALDTSYARARADAESAVEASASRTAERTELLEELNESRRDLDETVSKFGEEVATGVEELSAMVRDSVDAVQKNFAAFRKAEQGSATTQLAVVSQATTRFAGGASAFRPELSSTRETLKRGIDALVQDTHSGYDSLQCVLLASANTITSVSSGFREDLDRNSTAVQAFTTATSNDLVALQTSMRGYLDTDIQTDLPTGKTPRKRPAPQDALLPIVNLDGDRREVVKTLLSAGFGTKEVVVETVEEPVLLEESLKPAVILLKSGAPAVSKAILGPQDANARMRRSTIDHGNHGRR